MADAIKIPCSHCAQQFVDANALWQHTKDKHGKKAARAIRHLVPITRESSLAEELVEAIEDFHAGAAPPEHLLTMFPDEFRSRGRG